jgi:hypothetical protein
MYILLIWASPTGLSSVETRNQYNSRKREEKGHRDSKHSRSRSRSNEKRNKFKKGGLVIEEDLVLPYKDTHEKFTRGIYKDSKTRQLFLPQNNLDYLMIENTPPTSPGKEAKNTIRRMIFLLYVDETSLSPENAEKDFVLAKARITQKCFPVYIKNLIREMIENPFDDMKASKREFVLKNSRSL